MTATFDRTDEAFQRWFDTGLEISRKQQNRLTPQDYRSVTAIRHGLDGTTALSDEKMRTLKSIFDTMNADNPDADLGEGGG